MAKFNPTSLQLMAGTGITITTNTDGLLVVSSNSGVGSVAGTPHRMSVSTVGTAITLDIASDYVGQISITTLGTISTGVWNGTNLTESQITNLTSDLSACEKIANKGIASGYCPLDSSLKVPVANLPTINHTTLSNIGTNTHAAIDTFLGKFNLGTPSNNQILQYNGSAFVPATLSLTSSLSGLTDVTITSVADGNLLVYSSSTGKWINSNAIPDNIFFIKDDIDGTKKLQFQLSGITTGTTRVLTAPDASCTIVGDTSTQTLTNKTITDSTNNVMASSLKSATTTVSVSAATEPTANQALIATTRTSATWQTVNHVNLSNIGTNTHATIDTFLSMFNIGTLSDKDLLRYDGTSSKFVNVQDLTTLENAFTNMQISTCVSKYQSSVTQNTSIITSYTDSTDSYITYINNSIPFYNVVIAQNSYSNNNYVGPFSYSGTYVKANSGWDMNAAAVGYYTRYNITYNSAFKISNISISVVTPSNFQNVLFSCYGSNSSVAYNDTSTSTVGLTLLNTYSPVSNASLINNIPVSNSSTFKYVHVIATLKSSINTYYTTNSTNCGIQVQQAVGGYVGITAGTNYTISTDSTTGSPKITYTDASTINISYNETTLLLYEAYRRLYPVIRDTNTINLGAGAWTIANSSGTLQLNTNKMTVSSTGVLATASNISCGGNLSVTGAMPSISKCSDVSIATPKSQQVLAFNGTSWQNTENNLLNIDLLLYLNISMFTGSPAQYLLSGLFSSVFFDQTNATINSAIVLPTLTGNGVYTIYIQVGGTIGSYATGLSYFPNYIWTSTGYSAYGTLPLNTTIKLTFYASAGNPFGNTYPSWTYETLGSNQIPLKDRMNLYVFYTNNYHALTGYVGLPNLSYGQQLRFRDTNGYASTTSVQLLSTNSNTIDGNANATLNSNSFSKLYAYIGGGSSGNLLSL